MNDLHSSLPFSQLCCISTGLLLLGFFVRLWLLEYDFNINKNVPQRATMKMINETSFWRYDREAVQ
jgi:hypothetical protein